MRRLVVLIALGCASAPARTGSSTGTDSGSETGSDSGAAAAAAPAESVEPRADAPRNDDPKRVLERIAAARALPPGVVDAARGIVVFDYEFDPDQENQADTKSWQLCGDELAAVATQLGKQIAAERTFSCREDVFAPRCEHSKGGKATWYLFARDGVGGIALAAVVRLASVPAEGDFVWQLDRFVREETSRMRDDGCH